MKPALYEAIHKKNQSSKDIDILLLIPYLLNNLYLPIEISIRDIEKLGELIWKHADEHKWMEYSRCV